MWRSVTYFYLQWENRALVNSFSAENIIYSTTFQSTDSSAKVWGFLNYDFFDIFVQNWHREVLENFNKKLSYL